MSNGDWVTNPTTYWGAQEDDGPPVPIGSGGLVPVSPPPYIPVWYPPPARVVLPPPAPPPEEPLVAHDWGHFAREVITPWLTPDPVVPVIPWGGFADMPSGTQPGANLPGTTPAVTGGLGTGACDGMVWAGGVPPKGYKVVNHCGMGVLRKVRRRRRRRLLTASDKADISYIVATTGKGQLASSLIHRSAQ